jgi:beta-lactam-binding protein with PASTA domain
MSFITTITKGIGKLAVAAILLGAFLVGLVSVVYLSLRGEPVTVPEIIGKDRNEAEKELTALGLRMKKRADRYSSEKPDTILEQLPKSGDTVKTGQVITVVVARANAEGAEEPAVVATPNSNKEDDKDNEDSISPELRRNDKNKNKNKNTNSNENSNKKGNQNNNSNSNKTSNKNTNSNSNKSSNTSSGNNNKPETGNSNKSGNTTVSTPKPTPATTPKPTSGETRERKIP